MPPRSPFARPLLLLCAAMTAFSAAFAFAPTPMSALDVTEETGGSGAGARVAATTAATTSAISSVSLEATAVAVPDNGAFAYDAVISLAKPASYLQVRLRIRRPSGRLLFQKTYVKSNVAAGTTVITFSRPIGDLELRPDVYPVELTVSSTDNPPNAWKVPGDLRVYDPAAKPARVAVVIKVTSPPAIDPQGRFVADPGVETRARDEVAALSRAVVLERGLRVTLAISAELLQEWKRIASGYTYAGTNGLQEVAAGQPVPQAYADVLDGLHDAIETGRLEMLDVPYADPDVAGLSSTRRESDFQAHYRLSASAYTASVDETASSGTLAARSCLTLGTAREAAAVGIRYAIVSARYVRSTEGTPHAGVFSSPSVPLGLLVVSAPLSGALGGTSDASALGLLFQSALDASKSGSTPLPVVVEVGPGRLSTVDGLMQRISPVVGEPWVSFVTARTAADSAIDDSRLSLVKSAVPARSTPAGWWSSAAAARRYADALAAVLPAGDADGAAAVSDSLIAQSAAWAGPDGKWALADRGRAFSAAAQRAAQAVLDSVQVSARDLTLSGASGSVPFSITNNSGRPLSVVLRLTTQKVKLRSSSLRDQTLLPAENYVTVPVELRSTGAGRLRLQVIAGTLVIASSEVTVRASYLDRLAVVGAVAVVLSAMLFYIKRRVSSAEDAGTEPEDIDDVPTEPGGDAPDVEPRLPASAEQG